MWSFPADTALRLALTSERHRVVRPPNADWQGTETVGLTVCNPVGECATAAVTFRVENTPDDPVIEWIPDRVTALGRVFAPLDLRLYGWDPDGDEVAWGAHGGNALLASTVDGVLSVEAPNGWTGEDEIGIELVDSTGRSATRAVRCVVTEVLPVVITALGVEGILVECGETRILMDALVRNALPLSPSERERLLCAASPYDGVSLALITRPHYDHFDAGYVALDGAADALSREGGWDNLAGRVVGISFSPGARTEIPFDGVRVTAFHLEHTGHGNLPNLAYLIEVGGMRILYLGDATANWSAADLIAAFGGPSLGIDVLLASNGWVAAAPGASLIAEAVAARFAIPIHFAGLCPPLLTPYTVGDATLVPLCAKGSSWIVPPRDGS
ncbi:MAG: MBL fold metallo-hydrolase [Candidatus Bipolaricaulota bacterium]|nr:MBL fold metallo-hydrolase [Candidatus Bipolaricaulota bacterium]